jgi:hypothetical protein
MTDEAVARYEFACERLNLLRGRWEAAGRPFTAKGTRGAEVEHPLHKVLRLQEILVDRLAARARPGRVVVRPRRCLGCRRRSSCIVVVGEVRLHEKARATHLPKGPPGLWRRTALIPVPKGCGSPRHLAAVRRLVPVGNRDLPLKGH